MTSLELFTSLSGISSEALAGMEQLQMNAPGVKSARKPLSRGLLIAALVSLLLLLEAAVLISLPATSTGLRSWSGICSPTTR